MNRLESELFDLEESLMRNDGVADGSTYSTIVGIANEVSELESENAKLRELVKYAHECAIHSDHATCDDCERMNECCLLVDRMLELGVEVDA